MFKQWYVSVLSVKMGKPQLCTSTRMNIESTIRQRKKVTVPYMVWLDLCKIEKMGK